jgi:predicted RNase H-like nuclease (RuvC/YqgF family)
VSAQAQAEIQSLRQQLQAAQSQSGKGNSQESAQLRNEINARDQKIAELERQASSVGAAASSGPMGNLRMQREINALKAQIDMLKKNEADMKSKYDQAIRKSQMTDDDI